MTDPFKGDTVQLDSPASRAFVVTLGEEMPNPTRGLQVGTDGALVADFLDEGENIPLYCLAGVVYPYRIAKIHSDGTDATGIVGLY